MMATAKHMRKNIGSVTLAIQVSSLPVMPCSTNRLKPTGIPRFFLDFLRASDLGFVDRRYNGLTPAQYIVVVLAGVGVWLLVKKAPPVTELKK